MGAADVANITIKAWQELGALAVLILAGLAALGFLIWRITKTQDRTSELLDRLFAKLDDTNGVLLAHDRQGQDILAAQRETAQELRQAQGCLAGLKASTEGLKEFCKGRG